MLNKGLALVTLYESTFNEPNSGFLRPEILLTPKGKGDVLTEELLMGEFPIPGLIFVSGRYQDLVDTFGYGSLFVIEYYSSQQSLEKPRDCEKRYRNETAQARSETEFMDIIEIQQFSPDFSFKENVRIKPGRLVLLLDTDNELLYGPVQCSVRDSVDGRQYPGSQKYDLSFSAVPSIMGITKAPNRSLLRFKINEIPSELIYNIAEEELYGDRRLLVSWNDLISSTNYEIIDYMDDHSLIKWFNDLPGVDKLTRDQIRQYRVTIERYDSEGLLYDERRQRLLRLLDSDLEKYVELRNQMVQEYLASCKGNELLENYMEKHREQILKGKIKELEEEARVLYEEKRITYQQEIEELESRVKEIKIEKEKSEKELEEKAIVKIREEISLLVEQKNDLQNELGILTTQIGCCNDIKELENQRSVLIGKKAQVEEDINSLNDKIARLNIERGSIEGDITKRLIELKPLVNLIVNGAPDTVNYEERALQKYVSRTRSSFPEVNKFINELHSFFKRAGREVSRDMLINILVAINQNYITILAGLPGVGKTSTVDLLAKATGLKGREDYQRFLEIPVARGWSSTRDVIGYYNPLNQRFENAPTGLFGVIQTLSQEADQYKEGAPFWVLLDEANLSPIEHYWSNFLNISDARNQDLLLGNDTYHLTDAIRFIATVNFDSTTEPLSDRLLDRAHVILLEAPEDILAPDELQCIDMPELPLTVSYMETAFGVPIVAEFTNLEEKIFKSIWDALRSSDKGGRPIILSPRTRVSMQNYCTVARELMSKENPLVAFDYAVAQKILPRLSGYDNFLQRLEEIRKNVRGLTVTTRILDNMIRCGKEEHGFFRFFC